MCGRREKNQNQWGKRKQRPARREAEGRMGKVGGAKVRAMWEECQLQEVDRISPSPWIVAGSVWL